MKVFSIITAFYNGNQYVSKLIDIAKKNEMALISAGIDAKVELVIVNDSPNITVQIPNITTENLPKIINHEKNLGIHQARVTGLMNCQGEYIVFLDQDDELTDDCLLDEYRILGNADIVVSNAYIEQFNGTKNIHFKSRGQFRNALDVNVYIKGHNQIVSPGQCLIRKSAIPSEWIKFVMKTRGSDDLYLWILMFYKKCKFVMCEKIVYTHKYTGSNLSLEETRMAQSSMELVAYMNQIKYIPNKQIDIFVRNRQAKIELCNTHGMRRVMTYLRNLDLFIYRIWWKIRGLYGKFRN